MASFLSPLLRSPEGRTLVNETRGLRLATRIEAAVDPASRKRGLLGRTHLDPDTALVIAPCSAVHTCFMSFALDILFVDRHGRVKGISRGVRPWRVAAAPGAWATIEMAAGTLGFDQVSPGDVVAFDCQGVEASSWPL